jgi:hypothetical protein
MSQGPASRAARMTVRRFASSDDADRYDLQYWMQIPVAERILHVWQLSREQWLLHDNEAHEPGLCRSVASVRRR